MSNFEKAIAKIIRENEAAEAKGISIGEARGEARGRAEGISIGEAKGRTKVIFQAVKKMLNRNVQDEDIMEYMDITKEELEKIKLQMA